MDIRHLQNLRRELIAHFDREELKALTYDLDIMWHGLPGERRAMKTYSLAMILEQNGRLSELLTLLQKQKPHVNWRSVLADAVQDETLQTYVGHVSDLLDKHGSHDDAVCNIVKKHTSDILQKLDGERKGSVLRFLQKSGLECSGILASGDADLQEANLRETDLSGVDFVEANLVSANLSKANLSGVDMRGADLRRSNLGGANLWGANLSRADLQEAHLWGANLNKAKLYAADLSGARLSGANLWGADLRQANLYRTYLWGANLDSADLRGAKHVTAKQLTLVKSMQDALLPDLRRGDW